MTDAGLAKLSRAAGLEVEWTDAGGKVRQVSPGVQRTVLEALLLPAGNAREIKDSLARLKEEAARAAPLELAKPGARIKSRRSLCLIGEEGEQILKNKDGSVAAPRRPGYYAIKDSDRRLAVVPARAFLPKGQKSWGMGVQLYALPGGTTNGFGDFAALGQFTEEAAALKADAVAISPIHALFAARPGHISPYAPSTRLFLNPLYAPLSRAARSTTQGLVDWPRAAEEKWKALRAQFARFDRGNAAFKEFVRQGGQRLLDHARFEVLDARFQVQGLGDWRQWPKEFHNRQSASVDALTVDDRDIAFQLFVQWRADQGLQAAQARAKDSGMRIGLITDMAVGMDPGGSHAWSAPEEILQGLTVGAPPDLFNTKGQNWGLTNLSPLMLRRTGFAGFIGTVASAMRRAGGIRLDHAMGLERLWVIPTGADAHEGVYLRYPRDALLGLLALESQRHKALMVAEDLGTVPQGFRAHLAKASMLGMRVLWFERDQGGFLPPDRWDPNGAALSTTHDLPTLAGWWCERDLKWRTKIGIGKKQLAQERKARAKDKKEIWAMLRGAGAVHGQAPDRTKPSLFIDGAFRALAATSCPLALLAVEDFVGEKEQPNIPGTIDEHPNWRRRLKGDRLLKMRDAKRRAAILAGRRT
jgi:4-alpha-glucanotransferase